MISDYDYDKYMRLALLQAEKAFKKGEVPVGAVIIYNDKVIAKAYNRIEKDNCAIAHAEILVIKKASKKLKDWRLNECTLVVTLEPCAMCCGAILNSRISKVVFGAYENNGGCVKSKLNLLDNNIVKPSLIEVTGGVLENECKDLMQKFFKLVRNK